MTEPTGAQTQVFFEIQGTTITALVDGTTLPRVGDRFVCEISPTEFMCSKNRLASEFRSFFPKRGDRANWRFPASRLPHMPTSPIGLSALLHNWTQSTALMTTGCTT